MEGRLQGGPRPSQRPPVRLTVVAAAVLVAALAASALIGGNEVRHHVAQSVARDSKLTSAERRHAAGDRLGFDAAAFDAFRVQLRAARALRGRRPAGRQGAVHHPGRRRPRLCGVLLPACDPGRAGGSRLSLSVPMRMAALLGANALMLVAGLGMLPLLGIARSWRLLVFRCGPRLPVRHPARRDRLRAPRARARQFWLDRARGPGRSVARVLRVAAERH